MNSYADERMREKYELEHINDKYFKKIKKDKRCLACGSWALENSPGQFCQLCSDARKENRK